ncbi:hypothetical protein VNO77_01639 [Canavalia gladiata]|uniref:Uncharacterized protein n=1 Tax=Canavalia gladiata TaxID=3824 RepID=A0AAN9MWS4_CANGL
MTSSLGAIDQGFYSFVEQTSKAYHKVFSYCLPSKTSEIGYLKFGKTKRVSKSLKFTLLGADYGIPLVGIKLGNTKLPIAFKKGAANIDSGSTLSLLPPNDCIKSHLSQLTPLLFVCHLHRRVGGGGDEVVFGNIQQKTLEIVYDIASGKFGFGYRACLVVLEEHGAYI